jgi:hypothetical protein
LSDPDAKFSKSIGWADAASGRTGRYAIVIDHGKVTYADIETERGSLKVRIPFSNIPSVTNSFQSRHLVPTPSLHLCRTLQLRRKLTKEP